MFTAMREASIPSMQSTSCPSNQINILILWGLFKKMVIADRALPAVSAVFDAPVGEYGGAAIVLGVLLGAIAALNRGKLINAAENRSALGRDESLANAKGVNISTLTKKLGNKSLIQRIGYGDCTLGPSGVVQHFSGFFRDICQVAAVQTDSIVFWFDSILFHFLKYLNCIRNSGN